MKRRSFVQLAAAAPPLAAVPAQAAQGPESPTSARAIEIVAADSVCEPKTKFFTAAQFATLRRLSGLIWPANGDNPGALDAGVPEFLDFLIGASPAPAQQLYRQGLDALEQRAKTQFGKPFASLMEADAGKLLQPLNEPWTYQQPTDPVKRFLLRARTDIFTATTNSREYALQAASTRRNAAGIGQYWHPLD